MSDTCEEFARAGQCASGQGLQDGSCACARLNRKAQQQLQQQHTEEDLASSSSSSSCSVDEQRLETLKTAVTSILEAVGEDPTRDGLLDTPERFAKALLYLTKGYRMTAQAEVGSALFEEDTSGELVVVKNIEFHSLCEHHMLPFHGRVTIGYLPEGKVLGLSKLARITEVFARRLQIQEKMSRQIAQSVEELARPRGVGVIIEAEHMCMSMRGVEKCQSSTVTVFTTGELRSDKELRREFFHLAGHSK